jgi:hypothetical protein
VTGFFEGTRENMALGFFLNWTIFVEAEVHKIYYFLSCRKCAVRTSEVCSALLHPTFSKQFRSIDSA